MIKDESEWGKGHAMELSWVQHERGLDGKRVWTAAHGLVWARKPKPERLLAAIYVRDGAYAISTLGLGGLEPQQLRWLERHLEEDLGLKKRQQR